MAAAQTLAPTPAWPSGSLVKPLSLEGESRRFLADSLADDPAFDRPVAGHGPAAGVAGRVPQHFFLGRPVHPVLRGVRLHADLGRRRPGLPPPGADDLQRLLRLADGDADSLGRHHPLRRVVLLQRGRVPLDHADPPGTDRAAQVSRGDGLFQLGLLAAGHPHARRLRRPGECPLVLLRPVGPLHADLRLHSRQPGGDLVPADGLSPAQTPAALDDRHRLDRVVGLVRHGLDLVGRWQERAVDLHLVQRGALAAALQRAPPAPQLVAEHGPVGGGQQRAAQARHAALLGPKPPLFVAAGFQRPVGPPADNVDRSARLPDRLQRDAHAAHGPQAAQGIVDRQMVPAGDALSRAPRCAA